MPSPHHLYTDHARPPCAGNAALLRGFASGPDDNMHDDFKPQFKGEKSDSVEQAIREDVSSNKVLLYMKVLPAMGVHSRRAVTGPRLRACSCALPRRLLRPDAHTAPRTRPRRNVTFVLGIDNAALRGVPIIFCRVIRRRRCAASATWPARYSTPTVRRPAPVMRFPYLLRSCLQCLAARQLAEARAHRLRPWCRQMCDLGLRHHSSQWNTAVSIHAD